MSDESKPELSVEASNVRAGVNMNNADLPIFVDILESLSSTTLNLSLAAATQLGETLQFLANNYKERNPNA